MNFLFIFLFFKILFISNISLAQEVNENKLNNKKDILIFVQSKKLKILERLKKRINFNEKLWEKFKSIQLPLDYKKKKSNFIIKNNFTNKPVKKSIERVLKEIL